MTQSVTDTATDAVGVTKVEFYMDGQLLASDTTAPYSYLLGTTKYITGTTSLHTHASDAARNNGSNAA